jgi:hypothetical protein
MDPWQEESMYKQLLCHDMFAGRVPGVGIVFGGESWDLESFRADIEEGKALSRWIQIHPLGGQKCNWDSGGEVVSLNATNFPRMRVHASNDQQAALVPEARASSERYRMVVGLAGHGVSLQRLQPRGQGSDYYLRHQNGRLMLQAVPRTGPKLALRADPQFAADATFDAFKPNDAPLYIGFKSYNYPDHWIRHFQGRLEIGTPSSRPGTPFNADRWFFKRSWAM